MIYASDIYVAALLASARCRVISAPLYASSSLWGSLSRHFACTAAAFIDHDDRADKMGEVILRNRATEKPLPMATAYHQSINNAPTTTHVVDYLASRNADL